MTESARPLGAFPWEGDEPHRMTSGFLLVGGNVTINMGYAVYGAGVLLMATTRIGDATPQVWRRLWSPLDSAAAAAENLAADAEEYMFETLHLAPRPVEDLDLDDFIEHLHLHLTNSFH